MSEVQERKQHVVLATHSNLKYPESLTLDWGNKDPMKRGPVVASTTNPKARNAIGTHSGSYSVFRALSIASGKYSPNHRPDLHNTHSPVKIGPYASWFDPTKIVSLDPWGLDPQIHFKEYFEKGYDIRPTIAVTQAHLQIPEIHDAIRAGRLKVDGKIIKENMDIKITKVAIEPVWFGKAPERGRRCSPQNPFPGIRRDVSGAHHSSGPESVASTYRVNDSLYFR